MVRFARLSVTPAKYQHGSEVVEAMRVIRDNLSDLGPWLISWLDEGSTVTISEGDEFYVMIDVASGYHQGMVLVRAYDWIIRDVVNHPYKVSDAAFSDDYQPLEPVQ
jgi:hypothetical protein